MDSNEEIILTKNLKIKITETEVNRNGEKIKGLSFDLESLSNNSIVNLKDGLTFKECFDLISEISFWLFEEEFLTEYYIEKNKDYNKKGDKYKQ